MSPVFLAILCLLIGLAAGFLAAWLAGRERVDAARAEAQAEAAAGLAVAQERLRLFEAERPALLQARDELDRARRDLAQQQERAARVPVLDAQLNSLIAELKAEREAHTAARTEREQVRARAQRLAEELAELSTRLEAERAQSQEKLALLAEARESLSGQFRALANDIL